MGLAAGDLCSFVVAQVVGKKTAFRLNHKVKAPGSAMSPSSMVTMVPLSLLRSEASTPPCPIERSAFLILTRALDTTAGNGFTTVDDELFVIKVNAVGRFVFDAIPKRLELGAFQDCLPGLHDDPFVGILDIELASDFLQYVANGGLVGFERLWQRQRPVLDRGAQCVLHLAVGIDKALRLEVLEDGGGFIKTQHGS